jgi:hypothetical protein
MRSTKRDSVRQENRWARDLDGRTTSGSGCSIRDKSDVVSKHFRMECKTTRKPSYSLKARDLKKIEKEARESCRIPLFAANISNKECCVVPVSNIWKITEKADPADLRRVETSAASITLVPDYDPYLIAFINEGVVNDYIVFPSEHFAIFFPDEELS